MGTPKDKSPRRNDETPVEVTHTQGFWLGKYEITQPEWTAVMGTTPWKRQTQIVEGRDQPATWLTWEDADAFGYELSEQERLAGRLPAGWEYRLPTEAQWEYACRAGTTTRFFFGDEVALLPEYGWTVTEKTTNYPHPIGQKKPNPWGFYDICGNTLEWCRDWYSPKLPGGNDPEVKTPSKERIFRNWGGEPMMNRTTFRHRYPPAERNYMMGFRVALVKSADSKAGGKAATISVAVIPFENAGRSIEPNRLGGAISSMLAADLGSYASLTLLERQAADGLVDERNLANVGVTDPKTGDAQKLKDVAQYVIAGTFAVDGSNLALVVKLMKPGLTMPVQEWKVEGKLDDLLVLEQDLIPKISQGLGVADSPKRQPPPAREGASPTVAILPFVNQSTNPRLDVMQEGFAEILQAELSAVDGIRLVERSALEKVLTEQNISLSGLVEPSTAIKVGQLLQAQRILVGSFLEIGKQVSFQVRLVNTGSGAVMAFEKVSGPSDDFSKSLEQLALKLAADMTVPVTDAATQAVQSASPAKHLEAAVHFATAGRFRRLGKLPEAAAAYQQAILIDPDKIQAYVERMRILEELKKKDEAIRVGEQVRALPGFPKASVENRISLVARLAHLYSDAGRYDELIQLADFMNAHVPELAPSHVYSELAQALARQHRYADAARLLEENADKMKDVPDFRNMVLRDLFNFYAMYSRDFAGKQRGRNLDEEASREACRKSLVIFDRVVESAKGFTDADAHHWPPFFLPGAVTIRYRDEKGVDHDYLSPAEKIEYLERGLKTFGWHAACTATATYALATYLEKVERWEDASNKYRERTTQQYGYQTSIYPPLNEWGSPEVGPWIDHEVESYYRSAMLLDEKLNREEAAVEAYQRMVKEFGLSSLRGSDTLKALHKRGIEPQYPEQGALIIGGGGYGLRSWQNFLKGSGYVTHSHVLRYFTGAHLAPYRLVVLARPGNKAYTPDELLALRSYVGSGGSLLIVISPGWEPAAPYVHNPLLAFFDMEAHDDAVLWADSTKINPHPITAGIKQIKAKREVGLKAPSETVLIQAGDRTVLAATPYRMGRVAVATLGQWLVPDTTIMSQFRWNGLNRLHWTQDTPTHELPLEFEHREHPLLRNVVHWLTETSNEDENSASWTSELKKAHSTARKTLARALPWTDLKPSLDQFIDQSRGDQAQEESLWMAAESAQQWLYIVESINLETPYSFAGSTAAAPGYYRQLIKQFPDSPLRPYAEVRLADCERCESVMRPRWPQVIAAYEKAKLKTGTYPWAWQQQRLGELKVRLGKYTEAAEHFRKVAETMPSSPEKMFALLSQGACYESAQEVVRARRCFDIANSLPHLNWLRGGYRVDWFPTRSKFDPVVAGEWPADSRDFIKKSLERLNAKN